MKFTGVNLMRLRYGISLAVAELHNQIATCPDVIKYADDITQYEEEKARFENLLVRIDAALEREAAQ